MTERDNEKWLVAFPAFFFLLLSFWSFNYFELNSKHFRIKNELQFWKTITYRTDDILEIVMQSNGKAPDNLTLILKDFTSLTYAAAALRNRNWRALQTALEKQSITVRNTII
ncbi:hypothetical protein OGH69_14900 [Flavobacterium sp. MFBS3-15]|uniref:hypothetical protein n=1 Tax=Flavobacterium sp. MFBS3-15 TaxID=2989816 RepID=UPI00223549EE|nr:hypothetical protein [Flavobacterium sp. MFBS3-15]MCW4470262.1 hypothetical protein [Flavobacterium sp. MFBS3-15]